jgi:hypothetical protein
MSDSSQNDFFTQLEDRFGLEGYARYWKLVEAVAQGSNPQKGHWKVAHPWSKWQEILKGKRKKLETFLEHLANLRKIFLKSYENILEIEIPKLKELKDEYARKSGQTPDKCPERVAPEGDTEGDKESLAKDEASFACQDAERPDDKQGSQNQEKPDEREKDLTDPGIPNCPHKEIIAAYHEILPELNVVKVLTQEREKWLRTRWREDKKRQSVQWWRQYWQLVRKCPHLMGQNDRNWKADFAWLIRPNNFAKVYEGRYLPKKQQPRLGL